MAHTVSFPRQISLPVTVKNKKIEQTNPIQQQKPPSEQPSKPGHSVKEGCHFNYSLVLSTLLSTLKGQERGLPPARVLSASQSLEKEMVLSALSTRG